MENVNKIHDIFHFVSNFLHLEQNLQYPLKEKYENQAYRGILGGVYGFVFSLGKHFSAMRFSFFPSEFHTENDCKKQVQRGHMQKSLKRDVV